ncbi:acyltransferase domain-containing protein [Bifidobacterium oedipodis]|uniref:GNAT-like C-terminal domain-containing protein n=1 Tax=Bifidobacterium oedipodis TaxID=2675322 RepID=A0A7Y0ENP8_9BIFI|nr:acyltransferase domain-containing protein [Bifidobacterium sp. DSM 109957]NMM93653.1 hypothetical protein [Bifidobacterium sp. DSM 109957]
MNDNDIAAMLPQLVDPATARQATTFIRQTVGLDDLRMLAISWQASQLTLAEYRRRGIPDTVFVDTMECFTRFSNEHRISYGTYGFDRDSWTWRQLSLRLFRLGQLEFEYPCTAEDSFLPGDGKQINIHIASNASIAPEACADSLRRAKTFTERFFPEYADAPYACDSWLLSPELAKLLPDASNIIRFQRMFDIVAVHPEDSHWREWVFQRNPAPVAELPEHTSLQRAIKRHLLQGGYIGAAVGRLKPCGDEA